MSDIIISFDSPTAAAKARSLLNKNRISGNAYKSSQKDCGFCIKIPSSHSSRAIGILKDGRVNYKLK
ncbi:MAG: DUF3343 domain-containing protein [Firmicutes bacterium]|nr:DUF3343 domain-containing protein [Bacillota bacterium]